MPTITIEKGQNLLDACLQAYGTLARLFDLIAENELAGVDAELEAGQVLVYQSTPDEPVQGLYRQNRLVVNTGEPPADTCTDSYTDPEYTDCAYTL